MPTVDFDVAVTSSMVLGEASWLDHATRLPAAQGAEAVAVLVTDELEPEQPVNASTPSIAAVAAPCPPCNPPECQRVPG